jgi:hypothetical protein
MGKKITWLVLAASLLWLAACTKKSEAIIHVFNKGTLQTYVDLDYAHATLNPGQTETFTVNWPGSGTGLPITVISYPVGQEGRAYDQYFTVRDGDELNVNVEFH